jgi:hypothetical protein
VTDEELEELFRLTLILIKSGEKGIGEARPYKAEHQPGRVNLYIQKLNGYVNGYAMIAAWRGTGEPLDVYYYHSTTCRIALRELKQMFVLDLLADL